MSLALVQIRNVPTDVHRRLKARAAIEGISMSDFILRELKKALETSSREEVLERLRAQPPRKLSKSPADMLRAERDGR